MKALKTVLIVILVIILAAGVALGAMIYSMGDPKPLVSGDGDYKILCVGDSITYGQGVLGARGRDSYPAILSEITGATTVNYGLCNRTLLSTGNFPYKNEHHYADSLAEKANAVIIMLGSNDSKPQYWDKEAFIEEYTELVRSYREMPTIPVVYVMIPPAVFIEQDGTNCDDATVGGELADAVRQVADELSVTVIDLYSLTAGHPEWFSDGLHPNAEGNRAIAEKIAEVILK